MLDTVEQASRLRRQGYALSFHKDYLIGPGCTAMQVVSLSLEGAWLTEDAYPEPQPLCTTCESLYGTGFQLDTATLVEKSRAYFAVL
ncbi:hypothetical protein [Paenibacillus swuensis]|uniref:hypothetical protein n=1 Tax=Paenibacillus swuensis TaxID=1178515 RepID=UPI0012FCCC50|nr:hypothetical protein [Paenibacillus swuensis]